jgi:hypothetical protein
LFVVARLADRHGVRVRLLESTYGGVQALVLVPNALLVSAPDDESAPDGEVDRDPIGDGAPGLDGGGFGAPARVPANGRHPEADGPSWQRDSAPRRSPTATAPDRPAPSAVPRHLPSARSAASSPQAPAAQPRASAAPPPTSAAASQTPTVQPKAAPPPQASAADPPQASAAPRQRAAPAAAQARSVASPQASAAPAEAAAAPPSTEKPALPERRPGTTAPASRTARATSSVTEAAAADVESDATDTAALPTVMGVPPLPERRPQGHLAKGLRGRPTATADGNDDGAGAAEPAAGRSSTAMSALQSGTRRSRKNAPESADGSRG